MSSLRSSLVPSALKKGLGTRLASLAHSYIASYLGVRGGRELGTRLYSSFLVANNIILILTMMCTQRSIRAATDRLLSCSITITPRE